MQPPGWRVNVALVAVGVGCLALGLALLLLQGGSVLGLIPGVPGALLVWGGIRFIRWSERSGRLVCDAKLTGDLLRIDGHDVRLDEDYLVLLARSHGVLTATFTQGGQTHSVAWPWWGDVAHPLDEGDYGARDLRRRWGVEGSLGQLQFEAPGAFGTALLAALERNADHDRLVVLGHAIEAAGLSTSPDPEIDDVLEIADGAPGREGPYRGGASTPADGQRFLDDFRQDACELAAGVHVGDDYVTVSVAGATVVIPFGPVTGVADGETLELRGPSGTRSVPVPDPAAAEVVARRLARLATPKA